MAVSDGLESSWAESVVTMKVPEGGTDILAARMPLSVVCVPRGSRGDDPTNSKARPLKDEEWSASRLYLKSHVIAYYLSADLWTLTAPSPSSIAKTSRTAPSLVTDCTTFPPSPRYLCTLSLT